MVAVFYVWLYESGGAVCSVINVCQRSRSIRQLKTFVVNGSDVFPVFSGVATYILFTDNAFWKEYKKIAKNQIKLFYGFSKEHHRIEYNLTLLLNSFYQSDFSVLTVETRSYVHTSLRCNERILNSQFRYEWRSYFLIIFVDIQLIWPQIWMNVVILFLPFWPYGRPMTPLLQASTKWVKNPHFICV